MPPKEEKAEAPKDRFHVIAERAFAALQPKSEPGVVEAAAAVEEVVSPAAPSQGTGVAANWEDELMLPACNRLKKRRVEQLTEGTEAPGGEIGRGVDVWFPRQSKPAPEPRWRKLL